MRKKLVKVIAVTLSASMLLCGCSIGGKKIFLSTGLSDKELFKIDGSVFSVSEAMLYLTTEKNRYEQSYGTDIWSKDICGVTLEDYVKDNVKNQLAEIKALDLLAKKNKIKLSENEKEKIKEDAEKYFNALTDTEKKYMNVTLDDVKKAYSDYKLANKVYTELTKDINPEISDADAKVIKVASIYSKTYTLDSKGNRVEYTDEEKEKSKKEMQKLLDSINNGEDFMELAANNTDADKVEYEFGKGEMIQEFEDAAYQLKTDEVSGIVETPDGYYIIKCISDYLQDKTQTHKEEMIKEEKDKHFKEIYDPFIDAVSSEFNDDVWKNIKFEDMKDINVSNFYTCMTEDAAE